MQSTNRPPFSDSFLGRVRYNYQVSFEGPNKNAPLNPLARLYSVVRVKQVLQRALPAWPTLAKLPFYLFADLLRILGLVAAGSMYRYLPPKLGKLRTQVSFDATFYNDHPPKPVIHPNRAYSGGAEVGISDGEHLWIGNEGSVYRALNSCFFIGLAAPLFLAVAYAPFYNVLGYLIESPLVVFVLLWPVFSMYLFVLFPTRKGLMFHRRAQTATFYRGWLRRPVTVPYDQVTYTSGVDPSGGGGWLVIRAKVPDTFAIFGWAKLSTAVSDGMAQTAGAIDVFMDQGNDFAMPIRIKESIEWHRENNTTLWRYAGQEPPAEFAKHYKQPDSLYNKELCDPFSSVYDKAVFSATRSAARVLFKERQVSDREYAAILERRSSMEDQLALVKAEIYNSLDTLEMKPSTASFESFVETYKHELYAEFQGQFGPFVSTMRQHLKELRAEIEDVELKKVYFAVDVIPSWENPINVMNAIPSQLEKLKYAVNEGLLDAGSVLTMLESLAMTTQGHRPIIFKDYDWQGFRDRAIKYVLGNREDMVP